LAGGQGCVIYDARLFSEDNAHWFVATNMPLNTPGIRESYAELVRREALWQGVPKERILTAPGTATTTYHETIALRRLAHASALLHAQISQKRLRGPLKVSVRQLHDLTVRACWKCNLQLGR
jgi:hypothetical protein